MFDHVDDGQDGYDDGRIPKQDDEKLEKPM